MIVVIKCDKCKEVLQETEASYSITEEGEYSVDIVFDYDTFDINVEVDSRNPHLAIYKCPKCDKEHGITTRSSNLEEA